MKASLLVVRTKLCQLINGDGLQGDASGLRGDVDDCELTEADRKNGVDVDCLVIRTLEQQGTMR